jgi:hypothetical protein
MLNILIRPITTWPGKQNASPKASQFKCTYKRTLKDLEFELEKANAQWSSFVLEMWIDPKLIRVDGQLRKDARPFKPGVILRFTRYTGKTTTRADGQRVYHTQDVSYPCDAFDTWEDNLRAIALSMESLRRVERYGVFKYDEIISRLALPSADGRSSTREDAAAFIAQHSGFAMQEILSDVSTKAAAYKKAAIALHPDRGGDNEVFLKLQEALKTLA